MKVIPVILAGGSGSRLWPLSRSSYPKQFLPLLNEKTMLQETVLRVQSINNIQSPLIICHHDHRFLVAEQLLSVGVNNATIILEPTSKSTAPAATIAALHILNQDQDSILFILPADHAINDIENFTATANAATFYAAKDKLVTFGVKPTKPEISYGYIKISERLIDHHPAYLVSEFIEKPDLSKAKSYFDSGEYWWNSGMFMFKASRYLAEVKQYSPNIFNCCNQAIDGITKDLDFIRLDEELFSSTPSDSIDYAVMEKTKNAVLLPLNADWSDVGSWSTLHEIQSQDTAGNVLYGDVITESVKNSYLRAESRMLAAVGISDSIIIETSDVVLVTNKNCSQDVKKLVLDLINKKRPEAQSHRKVHRPWGYYESIYTSNCIQVKHITVKPKSSLSLQMHHHRSEHWIVVKGIAEVTRGNDIFRIKENESTYIPKLTRHRLSNFTDNNLEIIEIQLGTYLGEDDIIRFEDNYGRLTETA